MTHTESRDRRWRVLSRCRAYPYDTDLQVAAALGLTEPTVHSDRIVMGCPRRRTTTGRGIGPAQGQILEVLGERPLRVSTIATRAGCAKNTTYKALHALAVRGLAHFTLSAGDQRWARVQVDAQAAK